MRPTRRPWALYLVIALCAAPVLLSYFAYYVLRPEGSTNYGALLDPRAHPIPELSSVDLDGRPATLSDLRGKWVLLTVGSGACAQDCTQRLWQMRQVRLTQGREMGRIERVWLVTDQAPLRAPLQGEYAGTRMLRTAGAADVARIQAWLPAVQGATPADHLYLIDPLGNLMMRFPKDADPNRMRKDIARLLKASGIG